MAFVDINADANATPVDGVTEAWVVDPPAASADPTKLEERRVSNVRMRSYLVAIPGSIGELERRVATHRAAGGLAVIRICPGPGGHGYPLVSWAVSPIPEYCAREELALVIDFRSQTSGYPWSEIVDFARTYPRLAVVALGAPLNGVTAGRALDATSNLVLDTSAVKAADVAELAATRGAYRLAFGSGMARVPVNAVLDNVTAADAQLIFSGTANHLADGTWSSTYL